MTTHIFDADSPEVSATGATKVGSSYVLDTSSAEILIDTIDYGLWLAGDKASVTESLSGVDEYREDLSPIALSTTEYNSNFRPEDMFETTHDVTGTDQIAGKGWFSNRTTVNERVALDMESDLIVAGIRYVNSHNSGTVTSVGVKTVKIYLSSEPTDFNSIYGSVTGTMELMYTGTLNEHSDVDEADYQDLLFDTQFTKRYLLMDIEDNWGYNTYMGMRLLQPIVRTVAPTATYQSTDDEPPTNFVPVTPETLSELQARENTGNQTESFKIYVTGSAGTKWNEFSIETYNPDVTPPSIPTISTLEAVGITPNLGVFSDWIEPTDIDFDYVEGELNIDGAGFELIDNTASLGGSEPMKFNETKAGTQIQEAGWEYKNHYARNGYISGTTAQLRFRAFDENGNNSEYATSGVLVLQEGAGTKPFQPTINTYKESDSSILLNVITQLSNEEVYVRYRITPSANWSVENADFSRVGSGYITLEELVNYETYEIQVYSRFPDSTCNSDWSKPIFVIPRP